jgi:hypothetical protein
METGSGDRSQEDLPIGTDASGTDVKLSSYIYLTFALFTPVPYTVREIGLSKTNIRIALWGSSSKCTNSSVMTVLPWEEHREQLEKYAHVDNPQCHYIE